MKKVLLSLLIIVLVSLSVSARETLNFLSKPLAAGKAALTENSFYLDRVLGGGSEFLSGFTFAGAAVLQIYLGEHGNVRL